MTANPSAGELADEIDGFLSKERDYAPTDLLRRAVTALRSAPAQAGVDAVREAHQKLNILDLLISAGYDAEKIHPLCYKYFSYVKFTEAVRAKAIRECAQIAKMYRVTTDSRPIRKDYECLIGTNISIAILALIGRFSPGEKL